MTTTSKTYLQIVNDTIDEAGAELTSFQTDGSDFLTQTDAMMNRFKKWVNRAWREIQQDANDWHWLDETAVVTVSPGIMFFSDQPIGAGTKAINPATIVDIDGSTYISDLFVDGVQDLSGVYTAKDPFGYMDVRYSDYDPDVTTQGHVLDFGLKAGGFRLTRENDGKVRFVISTNNTASYTAATFIEVGDVVNSITVEDNIHSLTNTYTFTGGTVDSKVVDGQFVILQISYATASGDAFSKLVDYAVAAVADFNMEFSVDITTAAGAKTMSGTMRFDDVGNQFVLTGAISPLNFKVDFDAPVGIGSGVLLNDTLAFAYYSTTHLGNVRAVITDASLVIEGMFPSTTAGILTLNATGDTGVSLKVTDNGVDTGAKTCWTFWSSLLFAVAPVCEANLPGIIFYTVDGYVNNAFNLTYGVTLGLYDTLLDVDVATFDFTYQQPYTYKNYVHSWKSYDWGEEMGDDDFVENVRQTNNDTFRIISREDVGVSREVPLTFLHWDQFQNKYDLASIPPATPRVITEDNTGRYRLYPPPDRPYTLVFDYIREPQELAAYTDIPKGIPDEYVDIIMWRALQFYGEYDEQPSVAGRGRQQYKNMLMNLQQEHRPQFHFRPHRMY